MAWAQDFLANEGVTEDASHHVDLTLEEKAAAASSMKYHMKRTQEFLMPPTKKIVHNSSWDTGLSNFQTLVCLIQWIL